jgi:hypothetical protein
MGRSSSGTIKQQPRTHEENDLEGQQDMGGKHGGQKGMPRPAPNPRKDEADARSRKTVGEPRRD